MGEIAVCGGAGLCVAGNIAGGDGETLALHEVDPFVDERAQPDLGSLQIREDRYSHPGIAGGPADQVQSGLVIGLGAMAQVQPGNRHSTTDEFGHCLFGIRCRTKSAHNFRSTHSSERSHCRRDALAGSGAFGSAFSKMGSSVGICRSGRT